MMEEIIYETSAHLERPVITHIDLYILYSYWNRQQSDSAMKK